MDSYFDPRAPGSFGGVDALYRYVNKEKDKKTRVQVKRFLQGQSAYTLHKPVRRKFKRNITQVYTMNEQFQADLADLSSISKQNDGIRYLLTVIDVFSKYAWVIPLKNKGAKTVCQALETVFEERCPEKFQSDQGKEFENSECAALFKRLEINHFNALSGETKCAVVERFNRTLKTKMWKYLTYKNTYRYIDVLPDLVHSYNNTFHSAIKMTPSEVNHSNVKQVWRNLYMKSVMESNKFKESEKYKFRFEVGDHVRLSGERVVFRKGYEQGDRKSVYKISRRLRCDPPVYLVKDLNGEELRGVFYEHKLQSVDKPELFAIEKVLKRKGKGRSEQCLVKWKGYPKSFNSWVSSKEVVSI